MLYLLDANTLIDADRYYYPLDRVPEFWDWVIWQAEQRHVQIPVEIFAEMTNHQDALVTWLKKHREILLLDDAVDPMLVRKVLNQCYGQDLTELENARIGKDPVLVAQALKNVSQRVVVTNEKSKPSKRRGNRKLPDVCSDLHVRCYNMFHLIKELDFRTNWKQLLSYSKAFLD